ncbi:hypothetical protein JTB14_001843 [Gonioctena quinquepunctata]|nr:hypothetical protein JTB14_001843 [Gonioctena quinquepunctata]
MISMGRLNYPPHVELADSNFGSPGNIDMLLGADIFAQIILDGRISDSGKGPDVLNTDFGFGVMEKMGGFNVPSISYFFCISEDTSHDKNIAEFWELQNVPDVQVESPDDQVCEKIFSETVRRDNTGRFIVSTIQKCKSDLSRKSLSRIE